MIPLQPSLGLPLLVPALEESPSQSSQESQGHTGTAKRRRQPETLLRSPSQPLTSPASFQCCPNPPLAAGGNSPRGLSSGSPRVAGHPTDLQSQLGRGPTEPQTDHDVSPSSSASQTPEVRGRCVELRAVRGGEKSPHTHRARASPRGTPRPHGAPTCPVSTVSSTSPERI